MLKEEVQRRLFLYVSLSWPLVSDLRPAPVRRPWAGRCPRAGWRHRRLTSQPPTILARWSGAAAKNKKFACTIIPYRTVIKCYYKIALQNGWHFARFGREYKKCWFSIHFCATRKYRNMLKGFLPSCFRTLPWKTKISAMFGFASCLVFTNMSRNL